ncbi:uncharacterized protein LOC119690010 [Teleopsis dalmanni]|uniref:uncharacterized protein LOC119690010 n=1 Tax=Teleopsis dalmanni TaxID=139649 RepID=UPI0018CD4133|nr:uncharacterized protein LOC119690010 [Teleopsis dalmanni]
MEYPIYEQNYYAQNNMRTLLLIVVPQHRAITKQTIIKRIAIALGVHRGLVKHHIDEALKWAIESKKIEMIHEKFMRTRFLDLWPIARKKDAQTQTDSICSFVQKERTVSCEKYMRCPHCSHKIRLNQLWSDLFMKKSYSRYSVKASKKKLCKHCLKKQCRRNRYHS